MILSIITQSYNSISKRLINSKYTNVEHRIQVSIRVKVNIKQVRRYIICTNNRRLNTLLFSYFKISNAIPHFINSILNLIVSHKFETFLKICLTFVSLSPTIIDAILSSNTSTPRILPFDRKHSSSTASNLIRSPHYRSQLQIYLESISNFESSISNILPLFPQLRFYFRSSTKFILLHKRSSSIYIFFTFPQIYLDLNRFFLFQIFQIFLPSIANRILSQNHRGRSLPKSGNVIQVWWSRNSGTTIVDPSARGGLQDGDREEIIWRSSVVIIESPIGDQREIASFVTHGIRNRISGNNGGLSLPYVDAF